MIAGDGYIIFKTDVLFQDKVKIQDRELFIDPTFQPELHVRCYGEVVLLPLRMKKVPIMQQSRGIPDYFDVSPFEYKYLSDIEPEVQVGDRIYFHFNTIIKMGANIVHEEMFPGTSKVKTWFFKVRYDQVLCAVRQGEIVPIGSYALVEPDMQSVREILVPIAQVGADNKPLRDHLGNAIVAPREKWLKKQLKPSAHPLRGWVRYVGSPLKGDVREVEVGQLIYYRPNADWTNIIEGKPYYTIRQKHILGRVIENV